MMPVLAAVMVGAPFAPLRIDRTSFGVARHLDIGKAQMMRSIVDALDDREKSDCGRARKTGETARVGAGIGRRFTLARARGGAL